MKKIPLNNKENGFILVVVILMIVILSLIGVTGMIVAGNEVLIAGYINKSREAFYVSEAALEEAKFYILNDPMKGKATSVGAGFLTDTNQNWATDEFVGMILFDNGANPFTITGNNATTLDVGGTPLAGSYYIVFRVLDDGEGGASGVGSAGNFLVAGRGWTGDQWSGYTLVDSAGTNFLITGNDAENLTVSGTPASGGTWNIYGNVGSVDNMSIKNSGYVVPSFISNNPMGWILIDSGNNRFDIDDNSGFGVSDITLVNGAGTPAHGNLIVARPSWMYDSRSPLYSATGNNSVTAFSYPLGTITGNGNVTITKSGTAKGLYTMVSTGTVGKSNKAISMSINDTGNGDTLFLDWQEVSTP